MNKLEAKQYEDSLMSWSKTALEDQVAKISNKMASMMEHYGELSADPLAFIRKMKQRHLQDALDNYGKVDLSTIPMDRIPLVFAKLQADEAAARKDIKTLETIGEGEKVLKKQLEIAKKVLAEKTSTGGRA